MRQVKIFLLPQEEERWEEDPLGNQNVNKKHCLEERAKELDSKVEVLYQKLTEITRQTPETFHFDDFELRNGKLYCRDKSNPLTNKRRKLRDVGIIPEILGKKGLRELGFDIPRGKVTARQAVMLNKAEELPSTSDVASANDIELQEFSDNTGGSI